MLQDLGAMVGELANRRLRGPTGRAPGVVEELRRLFAKLEAVLTLGPNEKATKRRFETALYFVKASRPLVGLLAD